MGELQVRRYPDPVLKQVARPVTEITPGVQALARALVATMRGFNRCVGLAANQVGELQRLVVIDASSHPKTTVHHGLQVLINPRIVASEGTQMGREGCLSFPDITANLSRALRVEVEALGLEGETVHIATEGFEAVLLQHEIDHLDGILFIDRVRSPQDIFPRKRG